MNSLEILGVIIVVALVVLVLLFKAAWRVAEPNEALIISGFHEGAPDGVAESLGFKIVSGRGVLVIPGIQKVRRLSLDLHETELLVECVTTQGVPAHVRAVAIYKIGDDYASIANAARRFLDQAEQMDNKVHNVFAGHLRAIVGDMTMEDMIRDREQLTTKARASVGEEMQKLGLVIDSLQVEEIDDPTGYIEQLRAPHAAAVASLARVAQAEANETATKREQEANAVNAEAKRDADIKVASYAAEVRAAEAKAAQAGPLAEATARQDVVVQETQIAIKEADREQQRLVASVRRPAEAAAEADVIAANAAKQVAIAHAEAEAAKIEAEGQAQAAITRARGLAEADATEAKGRAEGSAIGARAQALAQEANAVIDQQFIAALPEIVGRMAEPFAHVQNMTMLNGAQGITEVFAQVLGQAGQLRPLLAGLLNNQNGNGNDNGAHPEALAAPQPAADAEA